MYVWGGMGMGVWVWVYGYRWVYGYGYGYGYMGMGPLVYGYSVCGYVHWNVAGYIDACMYM